MRFLFGPYYEGPPSDHFDGKKFFNPDRPHNKFWWTFFKWRAFAKTKPWPESIENEHFDTPPPRVEGSAMRASFVGHATVLIQTHGLNILTDPVWHDWCTPFQWKWARRVSKPGIHFDNLPKIDLVVLSHNHYDHMDIDCLSKLYKRDKPLIIVPLGNDTILQKHDPALRSVALDWHESYTLRDGVTIHLQPAQHWSGRSLWDTNKALWGGYVIETPSGNIYFSGDTGYDTGEIFRKTKEKFGQFRLALLPIGAYEPRWFLSYEHMNPEESVRTHCDLGRPATIAIHYRTFHISDEAFEEPEQSLHAARTTHNIPRDHFRALKIGESWHIP